MARRVVGHVDRVVRVVEEEPVVSHCGQTRYLKEGFIVDEDSLRAVALDARLARDAGDDLALLPLPRRSPVTSILRPVVHHLRALENGPPLAHEYVFALGHER